MKERCPECPFVARPVSGKEPSYPFCRETGTRIDTRLNGKLKRPRTCPHKDMTNNICQVTDIERFENLTGRSV